MLNIEKEREAFSNWHESEYGEHVTWCDDVPASYIHNDRWTGWKASALRAEAKLDGCVVVTEEQAKDTARLDFMLSDSPTRTICHQNHWSDDDELIKEGQCVAEIYWIDGWDYLYESISETKREAIDKAMIEAARGGK